jgi:hypothetical protein
MGTEAKAYVAAARQVLEHADLAALDEAAFRPFFLVNGLAQAAQFGRHADRAFMLEVLAAGLVEFADYFEAIHPDRLAPEETPEEFARLLTVQRRYFAYCAAQLSEAGMSLEGIWMTMKGDSLDQKTSSDIRDILEEGPEKIAASPLYSDREKQLWAAAYAQGLAAFEELRQHLVSTYQLPFKRSPTA